MPSRWHAPCGFPPHADTKALAIKHRHACRLFPHSACRVAGMAWMAKPPIRDGATTQERGKESARQNGKTRTRAMRPTVNACLKTCLPTILAHPHPLAIRAPVHKWPATAHHHQGRQCLNDRKHRSISILVAASLSVLHAASISGKKGR